jgi:hypothetical protein
MGEKSWSTPRGTIHWSREFCKVPLHFMHNLLIKTLYGLCKSCRRSANLQLSYLNLGILQFNFSEIHPVKVGQSVMFATRKSRAHAGASAARRPHCGSTGPRRRGRDATWRARCSIPHHQRALHLDHRLSGPLSLRHAPRATRPQSALCQPPLPVARHWLATTRKSPPYLAHAVTMP